MRWTGPVNWPRHWVSDGTPSPRIYLIFLLASLLVGGATTVQAIEPHTGVIGLLFIGDPFMRPGFPTPALVEDPKISVTGVLAELAFVTKKEMTRFMRIYLPRTKKHLVDRYDLVALAAIRSDHLSPAFEKWIAEGVLEGGLAVLMSDDPVSFACIDKWLGAGSPGWMETPVGKILPVDDNDRTNYEGMAFKFKATEDFEDHPFVQGIPWHQVLVAAHNRPTARPGAKVIMRTSGETLRGGGHTPHDVRNAPAVVYWDIERGRSMALIYDWGGNGVTQFYRWEYWRDVVARWFYLPVGAEIPTDVQLTHSVRQMMADYGVQRGIVISVMEFADKMGANVRKVEVELGEIHALRKEADDLWIQGEFEECRAVMEEGLKELEEVAAHAVEAKDTALFWVYVTEWAAVTGTLCMAGGLVWTLMIRRAVYKEVRTTKFLETSR